MKKFFETTDNFEQIIKNNFNDVIKIEKVLNGWTNFVFIIELKSKDKYFFRFPRNDFFSDAIVSEVKFNNFVKGKISFKTTDLKLMYDNNRPYSVHKIIKGKNLYEVLDFMPQDKKVSLCNSICLFIKELQAIDYTECKDIQLLSEFLYNLAIISRHNNVYDFSVHNVLIEKEKNEFLVLNHGDLNPGNILINDNYEIEAILDFAFCTKSCDLEDLSRIIGRMPKEYKNMLINSYENIFNKKVNIQELESLIKMWNYVDKNYIDYMKVFCPDVALPKNI